MRRGAPPYIVWGGGVGRPPLPLVIWNINMILVGLFLVHGYDMHILYALGLVILGKVFLGLNVEATCNETKDYSLTPPM